MLTAVHTHGTGIGTPPGVRLGCHPESRAGPLGMAARARSPSERKWFTRGPEGRPLEQTWRPRLTKWKSELKDEMKRRHAEAELAR